MKTPTHPEVQTNLHNLHKMNNHMTQPQNQPHMTHAKYATMTMIMTIPSHHQPALQSTLLSQAQHQLRQPAPPFLKEPALVTWEMPSNPTQKFKVLLSSVHHRES